MTQPWPLVKLCDVLTHTPRPVQPALGLHYREIGIRSHGRGIFHKPDVTALEIGDKRVFAIEPGDFVVNIVFAWEGAVAIAGADEAGMIASHRFPTFRPVASRLDARWLLHYFRTPDGRDLLGRVSPGGAGRNRTLSRGAFLDQAVPIPAVEEQRRIIARIEGLVAHIDEARALRERAMEEASALAGAQARALFRLIAARAPIDVIAEVRGGIQKGPHRAPGASPVRYLTVAHVQRNQILTGDARYFEVTAPELDRWRLRAGDVLIIEGNGSAGQIGRTAMFRGEIADCVHQNHVIRMRPDPEQMLPEFLNAFLNSPAGQDVVRAQSRTSSGLRTLSVGRIKAISVPVPSVSTQRTIVAALGAVQAAIDSLGHMQTETSAALDALLPAILDRAFRGEL